MEKLPKGVKKYSRKEIAKISKIRTISDAELLKGGAEYKVDKELRNILDVTKEQKEEIFKDSEIYNESDFFTEIEKGNTLSLRALFEKHRELINEDLVLKIIELHPDMYLYNVADKNYNGEESLRFCLDSDKELFISTLKKAIKDKRYKPITVLLANSHFKSDEDVDKLLKAVDLGFMNKI